jgi:NTP pyrophosphatase (non-canonical NTP hydrolase)
MDLRISDLQKMQTELQDSHPQWGGVTPARGRDQLLWGICEIGEVIDIIKKRGDDEIMNNPETRRHLIEEMADVMMYLTDVMLCFGISAEEYSNVHARKHAHNMKRDWSVEIEHMFDNKD